MGSYNIEIPHPVFEVEVDFEPAINVGEISRWFARIEVGGIVLMKREYDAEWTGDREKYTDGPDEAKRKILEEFGAKLKEVLA